MMMLLNKGLMICPECIHWYRSMKVVVLVGFLLRAAVIHGLSHNRAIGSLKSILLKQRYAESATAQIALDRRCLLFLQQRQISKMAMKKIPIIVFDLISDRGCNRIPTSSSYPHRVCCRFILTPCVGSTWI